LERNDISVAPNPTQISIVSNASDQGRPVKTDS